MFILASCQCPVCPVCTAARAAALSIPDQNSAAHIEVLDAMVFQGGSFVVALAEAWRRADGENHARLYGAFAHYYRDYLGKAAIRRAAAATVEGGEV